MNFKGRPMFTAYSAGSHPAGTVRPEALRELERAHIPLQDRRSKSKDLRSNSKDLRSKSWDEFTQPGAPKLDFVITVCDNAAKEVCPMWSGQTMTAHWGVPDPAAVRGRALEVDRAYRDAFSILDLRIGLFLALPIASIDKLALKKQIDGIGRQ